ncbi:ThiF family adenylyltransferase [archaeon]|nr:ThiF family adenylyltransferase [archaeon]
MKWYINISLLIFLHLCDTNLNPGQFAFDMGRHMNIIIVGLGILGTRLLKGLLSLKLKNRIKVIDRDIVEEKNIGKQLFYTKPDVGKPKAGVIGKLFGLEYYAVDLNYGNIGLLGRCFIVDCTDNLHTRFLINDYCKKNKMKAVFAAVTGKNGFVFPVLGNGACLRCFLKDVKGLETCETAGVDLGVANKVADIEAGIVRDIANGKNVLGKLFYIGGAKTFILDIKEKKNCQACNGNYEYLAGKGEEIVKFCGNNLYQFKGQFNIAVLKRRNSVKIFDGYAKIDCPYEIFVFNDRALVRAKDIKEAKSLFSRFVGN